MPIEEWVLLVLGLSFLFYGTATILLTIGLNKAKSPAGQQLPFVSVIVAARNEEQNIPRLLDSLLRQSYSSYEIIIVDDESSDQTLSLARNYAARERRLTVLSSNCPAHIAARKKAALTAGILASKGEILCFTDADCVPGREWITELTGQFTENVGLVAGYSPYDNTLLSPDVRPSGPVSSLLSDFIRYEEMKGAIWSAGSIGLGKAWLCTGRNLAYRRKVWDQVSGFFRIMASISGDDDLFVQLVRRSTSWRISYVFDPKSFVPTAPPASFRSFVEQRTRHFSAGRFFTFPMKAFFLLYHGSNLVLFIGLLAGLISPSLLLAGMATFLGKVAIDIVLAVKGASLFSEDASWLRVIPMEFLCLSYNTFIGPLGFFKDFEWKPDLKS